MDKWWNLLIEKTTLNLLNLSNKWKIVEKNLNTLGFSNTYWNNFWALKAKVGGEIKKVLEISHALNENN